MPLEENSLTELVTWDAVINNKQLIAIFTVDPDLGMPQGQAQKYFMQLIDGVVSIHHSVLRCKF